MSGRLSPTADLRLFRSRLGAHLFVADGSRVYDLDPETAARLERLLSDPQTGDSASIWRALGLTPEGGRRRIGDVPLAPPPLHSVSLNVAQACNMSCHYCYAETGTFGGRARLMSRDVAEAAVERLIAESEPGARLLLGFMGGEPLLNRDVIHHVTRYAVRRAAASDREMRFSITTNATLLAPADAALFAEFPFGVQVSLDGRREEHDAARPLNAGGSSYDLALAGLRLMERAGRPRQLSARVTVTPHTGELLPILDHLIGLDFDDVGFAAVVVSPSPAHAFAPGDFSRFLQRMIECGRATLDRLIAGERYPFGNFETALHEIHRGSHRPYPCGAGAAYLSANAEGRLFACHRLIDDPAFAMGDVHTGSDLAARAAHLAESRVDRMEPCRTCWARYLCGGGCYHEVKRRGRLGCDYVRGWLEFCLSSYIELAAARPAYFDALVPDTWTPSDTATTLGP